MHSPLQQLLDHYVDAHGGGEGLYTTPIKGLTLMRVYGRTLPCHTLYKPSLCIVVQGAKRMLLGEHAFDYGEMQALVASVDLPVLGHVTQASRERPYLGVMLDLDAAVMQDVLGHLQAPRQPELSVDDLSTHAGLSIETLDPPLIDCVVRMMRLLAMPEAVPLLWPGLMREISFWLLTGRHGARIARIAQPNGQTQRIAQAVHAIRDDLAKPVRLREMAGHAGMSLSSFQQHFKALTAMTPLQYQKHLRLMEARRLMVSDAATASAAAYQVGYESASQFSREYARFFGEPPRRHSVSGLAALR